jgi:hypothetical protein
LLRMPQLDLHDVAPDTLNLWTLHEEHHLAVEDALLLTQRGINPVQHVHPKDGATFLHLLLLQPDSTTITQGVASLTCSPLYTDARMRNGCTVLHELCRHPKLWTEQYIGDAFRLLKQMVEEDGGDLNAVDGEERTPFLYLRDQTLALQNGVVQWCVEHGGADVNAVESDNKRSIPLLHHACRQGMLALVKACLARPDIDLTAKTRVEQWTPMECVTQSYAARHLTHIRARDIRQAFIDAGAPMPMSQQDMESALFWTWESVGARSNMKALLTDATCTITADIKHPVDGDTWLMRCARRKEMLHMLWLLQYTRADVNATDANGESVLFHAARAGWVEGVKHLATQTMCDVRARNHAGDTAMHAAYQHVPVAQWMLKSRRFDPYATNHAGATPMDMHTYRPCPAHRKLLDMLERWEEERHPPPSAGNSRASNEASRVGTKRKAGRPPLSRTIQPRRSSKKYRLRLGIQRPTEA